ncbi:MAG: hypothetical protein U1F08_01230 [Steroidobacteraceae bacterium]
MTNRWNPESDFERTARATFDAAVESTDADTRARLTAARRAAVAAADRPVRASWGRWAPATALATLAIAAVIAWRVEAPATVARAPDASIEPVELLADSEGLELVENDLAFYEWLDTVAPADGGGAG